MVYPLPVVIPLITLLAVASFFCAAAESALFSLGLWRARRLAESSHRSGALVLDLLGRPDDLLAALVFGNTVANAGVVGLSLLTAIHRGWHGLVFAILLLGLILIACEVTPKALAVRRPEFWALLVARPLHHLLWLIGPIRRFFQRAVSLLMSPLAARASRTTTSVSEEEYADLVELAHQQGTLGTGEKELILQVLSLDQRTAREVMKPRAQMIALPDDLSEEDFVRAARRHRHHRIPLYDESPDTIVAVLNTRTLLLHPGDGLDAAVEFPSFVPESMNLLSLFQALQRQQRGLAIVLDEFGCTSGLVTLEDILEAVVGPIRGEGEPVGFVVESLGPNRWRVNGLMRIDDFRREYPELGDVPEVETMGGLVLKLAEVVPPVDATFLYRGLRFTVRIADQRRIRELLVEKVGGNG